MSYINLDDTIHQLEARGILIDGSKLRVDGEIQRWKTSESKGGDKPGWTRLKEWQSKAGHLYIVGSYGVWQGNDDGYCRIELPKRDDPARPVLTDEDIQAARAAQKAAAKAVAEVRKQEAKTAGRWAAQVWSKCTIAETHEYLSRKGISPNGTRILDSVEGISLSGIDDANHWRLKKSLGALVVPMHDTNGNVCGLQFIFPKGHDFEGKQFWPTGMAMGGTFGLIGGVRRNGVLLIVEGFATAASLHEATGQPVAYAFSANNLIKTGKEIRAKYKQLRLLFCADDDYLTEQKSGTNPGVQSAQLAASEIERAAWTKPNFVNDDGIDLRDGRKLSDYNDLAVLTGLPLILANQINAKLDALNWRDHSNAAGANSQQGGGETLRGQRRRACSVMSLDDIVARFVPLDDGTGKYVFDTWTRKIAHREQMITLLPAGVRGDDIKRHPVWIERGAFYLDQVGFDPSEADQEVHLNTWQGWPMRPRQGECECIKDLLTYLCSQESNADDVVEWIFDWMAYPLQNPGAKMSSAIIMHGPQGTGKSTIFQILAEIYGEYSTVLNQRGIEDKFNADWADSKLFILAEEVVTRAEMWHIKNELKELVTGKRIRVNPKNIAAYYQKNQINIVYLSNENQPLPLENDDRRHLVVYTPPSLPESFYDDVYLEIKGGGVAAFYSFLMSRDLSKFHPAKRPPMTASKQKLIALSAPSDVRFITDWSSGDLRLPVCPCLTQDLYAAYTRYCRDNGERNPRPSNHFLGAIDRLPGWEKKKCRIYESETATETVPRPLVIPPIELMEEHGTAQIPGTATARWYTESVRAFSDAINLSGRAGERLAS